MHMHTHPSLSQGMQGIRIIFHIIFMQFQTITNALWCITNHHMTINDAALRRKEVLPLPPAFQNCEGFDKRQRKKLKSVQLSSMELNSHSQVLYSLLQKPVINSLPN